MLLFLLALIVFIIFIYVTNDKSKAKIALINILLMYFFATASRILYLSKDIYYYHLVKNFIHLPPSLWRRLSFLNIHRFWVFRFLNWSSIGIIWSSIYFALALYKDTSIASKLIKIIKYFVTIYSITCVVLFDPKINMYIYYFLYPNFITPQNFKLLMESITSVIQFINVSLIIISILVHIKIWLSSPKIKRIKSNYFLMMCNFSFLGIFYILFYSDTPTYFLQISKLTRSYTYVSLDLQYKLRYYNLFPYVLLIIFLFITYSIYKIISINQHLIKSDFEISKEISASDTTSKVFCHYIKNELLAIQSQLGMINENPQIQDTVASISKRCDYLYTRLDSIHRSTKTTKLCMKQCNLITIIDETLNQFSIELKNYSLNKEYLNDPIFILGDPIYLEQIFHNIISNSLDAMKDLPSDRKNLTFEIYHVEPWIIIEISDTGIGIMPHNIENVFTPFFSSHPISKHWGIGLSLVYKLIQAHEGKIEIESEYQKSTTVKIMFPNIHV